MKIEKEWLKIQVNIVCMDRKFSMIILLIYNDCKKLSNALKPAYKYKRLVHFTRCVTLDKQKFFGKKYNREYGSLNEVA